jgi:hypothetical protein
MKICNQCGVELDGDMQFCPLCDSSVELGKSAGHDRHETPEFSLEKKHVMRRILWQITAVLLISGVIATLVINIAIKGSITWSIYPITICLMILAYASLMALWNVRFVFHLLGGWLISSLLLFVIQRFFHADWAISLALPLVSAVNIVGIILYYLIIMLKTRGLNILALVFVSISVVSLGIESIISLHVDGVITLGWSVIVAACLLPATAAILFMYFRTRNNSELKKIFHT